MGGAPPPCNPVATPPAGAAEVCITWYAHWPILFTDCPPISAYESTLLVIHNNGGAIYSIDFKDGSGASIPGDWCSGAPPKVVPPPPPPSPPSPPPPPDPADDDLGTNFTILFQYLIQLINLIQTLTTQPAPSPGPVNTCCRSIVTALSNLTAVVTKIEATLSAGSQVVPPSIDLTSVVTELTCLCTSLTAISQSSATVATDLAPGLKSIADAVANAPQTDLKPLVDAINAFAKIVDVKQPVIDYLVKQGLLDPEMAQIAASADLGDTLANFYSKYGKYIIAGGLDTVGGSIASGHVIVPDPDVPAQRDLGAVFGNMLKNVDSVFEPVLKPIITGLLVQLAPTAVPPIGQAGVSLDAPASTAFGVAFTAAAASYIMSFFGLDAGATLAWVAELLSGAVGWEELRDLRLKPFIQHGIAKVVQMEAKARFQQELPGNGEITGWTARGLMDQARADELMTLNGLHFSLRPVALQAAETGLPPFLMIRLSGTGLFSDADIADELTFRGIRPTSQHRFIAAAAFLRTQPERNKFLATVERVYAAGLISDNNFIAARDSAAHNTDSNDLSLRTVKLEKQIALAHEYEAAYSNEFLHGLLDAPGYQSALEALGMQPPDVSARMFRDESHLSVTQTLGAERAARAALRKTQAEAKKAAIEGFRTGTIDSAALTAALNLAGLTPAQTAAEVVYQVLASSGVLRWIYGRHLSPQDATLLRQQVQDLTRQREIQMLTDAQYVSQLQALSIPPRVIQALRAGANAHISPKTQAILTPPVV